MNTLYKNYDLSNIHAGEDFVPRRSRDPEEIERRTLQRGTGALILEQQAKGIDIILDMLESIEDPQERGKAAQMLGGTLLFTAGHMLGLGEFDTMRRTLKLPVIAEPEGWRETPSFYEKKVRSALFDTSKRSIELAAYKRERRSPGPLSRQLGRAVGNTGLMLSVFPLPRLAKESAAVDIQAMVRESALVMHQKAQETSERLGERVSAAQLADPLSKQGLDIQLHASDEVASAYVGAIERHTA